jgi:hypothetical protein
VKAKLYTFESSWQQKPLYIRLEDQWEAVDIFG